jgi:hypothetical protein
MAVALSLMVMVFSAANADVATSNTTEAIIRAIMRMFS